MNRKIKGRRNIMSRYTGPAYKKSRRLGFSTLENGKEYKVASGHNDDGTVTNADEYDVLQITIDGIDPKAIWNFSFSVAPMSYYSNQEQIVCYLVCAVV